MAEITMDRLPKVPAPAPEHSASKGPGPSIAPGHVSGRQPVLLVISLFVAVAAALSLTQGAVRGDWIGVVAALVIFIGLFLLSFVTAKVYGRAATLQQRLALVDNIAAAGDARFGPDPVVRRMLLALRNHYGAEICIFVLIQPRQTPRLFCIEAGAEAAVEFPLDELTQLLPPLLAVLPGQSVAYNTGSGVAWRRDTASCCICDAAVERPAADAECKIAQSIAAALDCSSFVSVPLTREIRVSGRVFVGTRQRRFGARDVAFLHPVIEQFTLMLENTFLLEMLAAEAAEHERHRIARDLHDTAIQPYIGLKFGLEALGRKVRENPAVFQDIQHLIERTSGEIADMRQLINGLSDKNGANHDSLSASLRRQTARYSELFGITVEIGSEGEQRLSRSLAREILHMVSEGLSNICRHTRATKARINLHHHGDSLELRIANDLGAGAKAPPPFVPCSLSERAAALGGNVAVEFSNSERCTVITINIPLEE